MNINIYNQKAEAAGQMELPDGIFGLKLNQDLVHQAMVAQMANGRQVLAHTKTRGEVSGGGKKPWKQKGTGRARAGSSRSPIWIGGGTAFGPLKTRNFKKDINRKMRQKALYMVLADRAQSGNLAVMEAIKSEGFKTKEMDGMISLFEKSIFKSADKEKRSLLIINDNQEKEARFSLRNLAGVKVLNSENINILDILKYKRLMMVRSAVDGLSASQTKSEPKKAEAPKKNQ